MARPTGASVCLSLIMVPVLYGITAEPGEVAAATRLHALEVVLERESLVVTLVADGVLKPSSIHEAEHWLPRLVIDLPDVVGTVPASTRVEVAPINRIRVAAHSHDSLVTRVVLDLSGPTSYEIDGADGSGQRLRLVSPFPRDQQTAPEQLSRERFDGGVRWLQARAIHGASGPALSRAPAPEVLATGLLTGLAARPFERLPVDVGWSLPSPVMHQVAMVGAGARLVPEGLPGLTATGGRGMLRDDVALASGVEAAGVRLEPEAVPAARAVVIGLPPATQVVDGVPEPPSRSRITVPQRVITRPQAQLQQTGSGQQYTGDPVSMDFQNADLRAVLRTFAEISDLNIVIDPQIAGSVDVSLTDVPWDQALEIILRANRLGYIVDGTVVRIAPLVVLADEEAQRRALAEEQALSGTLLVLTRTLSYARAADMASLVTPLLSPLVSARHRSDRRAHEHDDHHRSRRPPGFHRPAARYAGSRRAAGGAQGEDRSGQQGFRPSHWRAVGPHRSRGAGPGQHHPADVSQPWRG